MQIKFPERPGAPPPSEEQEEVAEEAEPEEGKPDPRDVIHVTGRKEHCEAAIEALMVSAVEWSGVMWVCVCVCHWLCAYVRITHSFAEEDFVDSCCLQ